MKVTMKVFLCLIVAACGLRMLQTPDTEMFRGRGEESFSAPMTQCSMRKFKQTELDAHRLGLLNNSYNAQKKYHTIFEACRRVKQGPVLSNKTLIVNLGMGTTGTRWVNKVLKTLGFKTLHNPMGSQPKDYMDVEYVSDDPVCGQTYEINDAFPNAIFMMSWRDGKQWQKSRLKHKDHAKYWRTLNLCGLKGQLGDADAATDLSAREIWLSCVLPPERLFQYNLFNMDDKNFLSKLKTFLEKHGHQKPNWEEKFSKLMDLSYYDFAKEDWWAKLDELDKELDFAEVEPFFILDENGK
eukprot:gnl/MRDRNA2_/MRDRNA2_103210_c0_seq1.p1 gnl/MRDRNA2_/MRDRNA2_103210_c0~~gnl/MRDRNA2_/MRDRNA2_103210_c0_seq1.p1  ORF type:complete len:297 (-),score=52.31 gnl/MRDRNA2_/MRDRNA2_103210_c0_seq1:42-932(-)